MSYTCSLMLFSYGLILHFEEKNTHLKKKKLYIYCICMKLRLAEKLKWKTMHVVPVFKI